jgi:LAGLIDADG DNA endonuclease family
MGKQKNPGRGLRGTKLNAYLETIKLTELQREVLIGTLLGDATFSLANRKPKYSVKFEQGKMHEVYVHHLLEIFKPFVGTWPVERLINKEKAEKGLETPRYSMWFRTYQHKSLIFYYNLFYKQELDLTNPKIVLNKIKIVPKNIDKFLTPRAIAYWFMDDGSYENKTCMFNTQSFTPEDSQLLCNVLLNKYGIEAKLSNNKEKKRIRIKTCSAPALRKLIEPYVLPHFHYKLINI